MSYGPGATVAEVIEALKKFPPDTPVHAFDSHGCSGEVTLGEYYGVYAYGDKVYIIS